MSRWSTGRCARGHDITDPANVDLVAQQRRCRVCLRLGRTGLLPPGPLLALPQLAGMTARQVADACGVDPRTVCRWRSGTPLKPMVADIAAIKLGLHPVEVWGWAWIGAEAAQ